MIYLLKIILTNLWRWRKVIPPAAKTIRGRNGRVIGVVGSFWFDFSPLEGGTYCFEFIEGMWNIEYNGARSKYNSDLFLDLAKELKIELSQIRKEMTDNRIIEDLKNV